LEYSTLIARLKTASESFENLEVQLADPDVANDPKKLESIARERSKLEPLVNDFNKRFIELIKERFNIDSMRVKKLLNHAENDEIIIKSLLILSFCISNEGYQKLKNFL